MHPLIILNRIEKERNITLPKIYREFYDTCSYSTPINLIGTDIGVKPWLSLLELQMAAIELIEEDEIDNFLHEHEFVFMMHQGYQFWYFRADGNIDPNVFYYHEGKLKSENKGLLSELLKAFY